MKKCLSIAENLVRDPQTLTKVGRRPWSEARVVLRLAFETSFHQRSSLIELADGITNTKPRSGQLADLTRNFSLHERRRETKWSQTRGIISAKKQTNVISNKKSQCLQDKYDTNLLRRRAYLFTLTLRGTEFTIALNLPCESDQAISLRPPAASYHVITSCNHCVNRQTRQSRNMDEPTINLSVLSV